MERTLLYFLIIEILFHWPLLVHGDVINMEGIEYTDYMKKEDIADTIFHGLNFNEDACNDFYNHICGNYENKIEMEHERFDTIMQLARDYLDYNTTELGNEKLEKERMWYKTCLNENTVNEWNLIWRIIHGSGGLLLTDINVLPERTRNWQDVMKFYSHLFGTNAFFNIQLNKDNILKIIALEKMLDVNPDHFREVTNYMFFHFENLIVRNIYGDVKAAKKELYKFIDSMNELMAVASNEGTVLTIGELQNEQESWQAHEKINWLQLLQVLVHDTTIIFNYSDKIEINIDVIKEFSKILHATPNHAIVNYIHFVNIMNKEISIFWGTKQEDRRSESYKHFCIKNMPIYEGYTSIIRRDFFPTESEKFVESVFEELSKQMVYEIEHSAWKEDAKKYLIKKLKLMKLSTDKVIFSPDYPYENKSYNFSITDSNIENIMNFKKAQIKYIVEKYKNRKSMLRNNNRNRDKREISLKSLNIVENKVEFELSHIFSLLFDKNAPRAVTFAYLGFHISNQMAYPFYSLLWNTDVTGRYSTDDIISGNRITRIKNNFTQCFANQHESYWGDSYSPSLIEILTHSTAMRLTIEAFERIRERNYTDIKLSKYENLPEEQLFLYSLVAPFCSNLPRTDNDRTSYLFKKYKLNTALKNSNFFAQTFNCPQNSPMNPIEKCDILSRF